MLGNNEEFHVLDEFVCDAIVAPGVLQAAGDVRRQGCNEEVILSPKIVCDAIAEPVTQISAVHSEHSSFREKLLEHLFIGEVLRYLWSRGVTTAEFLRPEVDSGGYDIVVACNRVIRHIQIKSSHQGAKTAKQNVNLRLAEKPSGCVVWVVFDETTLALGPFLWFGGPPGKPLPDVGAFPAAKHTKSNAQGEKAVRPNIRVLKRGVFQQLRSVPELVERLFGEKLSS